MNAQSIQEIQAFQANEDDTYGGDYLVIVSPDTTIFYELDDLSLDLDYN